MGSLVPSTSESQLRRKMETEKFDAIVIGAGQAGPSLPAD
jgi:hypothetical protein